MSGTYIYIFFFLLHIVQSYYRGRWNSLGTDNHRLVIFLSPRIK